jgi:hypothetical protein
MDLKVAKLELKVDKTANVSWNVLDSDASCISGYEVIVMNAQNQSLFRQQNIKSSFVTVQNLSSCDVYSAQVTAKTARDENLVSLPATFHLKSTSKDAQIIEKLELIIGEVTTDSVALSWSSDSATCLQEYQLRLRNADNKIVHENNLFTNSTVISKLTSCNNYSVELIALNADRSALKAVIKSFYTHSMPIDNVTILVIKSKANVSWTPPPQINCISDFKLTYMTEDCENMIGDNVSCSKSQIIEKTKTKIKLESLPLTERFILTIYANEVTSMIDARRAKTWKFNTMDYEKFFVQNIQEFRLEPTELQIVWGRQVYFDKIIKHYEVFFEGNVLTTNKTSIILKIEACNKKNYTVAVRCVSTDDFKGASVTYQTKLNDDAIQLSAVMKNIQFEYKDKSALVSWTPKAEEQSCISHYEIEFNDEIKQTEDNEYELEDFAPCMVYDIAITPISHHGVEGQRLSFDFVSQEFCEFFCAILFFHID